MLPVGTLLRRRKAITFFSRAISTGVAAKEPRRSSLSDRRRFSNLAASSPQI
jgi:hypothetical protein